MKDNLHTNNKSNPFSVPDGYFDSLEDKLMNLSSELNLEVSDKNAFAVPDNYFKTLETKILTKHSRYKTTSYWIYGTVATAVLLIGLSIGLIPSDDETGTTPMHSEASVSPETYILISYLEDNYLDELDLYELEVLELEEEILSFPDISENNLQQYVQDEYEIYELIEDL